MVTAKRRTDHRGVELAGVEDPDPVSYHGWLALNERMIERGADPDHGWRMHEQHARLNYSEARRFEEIIDLGGEG